MLTQSVSFSSINRQAHHWYQASMRLSQIENLASGYAWHGIDHEINVAIKNALKESIDELLLFANALILEISRSEDSINQNSLRGKVIELRNKYSKVEETVHFYTVAINSRTNPSVSALLRACDVICVKSMQFILQPLGYPTPKVFTYVEKGMGASILKAGLRLWDGNTSKVAAIKITQHNLYRPTAAIHETGHQFAHIVNWNNELKNTLRRRLVDFPPSVSEAFASWASEMAADAFAFVHTGFAAVAALHDVVSGAPQAVFSYHMNDPHPISYIRVLLNIEMCRQNFGDGPWEELEESFTDQYDINQGGISNADFIQECLQAIPNVASILINGSFQCFRGDSLSTLIPVNRVSPRELEILEITAGPSLYNSHAWLWQECIRILALGGLKIGIGKGDLHAWYKIQEDWMVRLGYIGNLN